MARGKHRRRADLRQREVRAGDLARAAERVAAIKVERMEFEARAEIARSLADDVARMLAELDAACRDEAVALASEIASVEAELELVTLEAGLLRARMESVVRARVDDPLSAMRLVSQIDGNDRPPPTLVDNERIARKLSDDAVRTIARRRGGKI